MCEEVKKCKRCGNLPARFTIQYDTHTEVFYSCIQCMKAGEPTLTQEQQALLTWNEEN